MKFKLKYFTEGGAEPKPYIEEFEGSHEELGVLIRKVYVKKTEEKTGYFQAN